MTRADHMDGRTRPIENLLDQQTHFLVRDNESTLQPAFDRMYWRDFPLEDGDAAAIAAFGH